MVYAIDMKGAEEQFGSSNGQLQEKLGAAEARSTLGELGYGEELIIKANKPINGI